MSILSAIFGPLVPPIVQPPKIHEPPTVEGATSLLRRVVKSGGPLDHPPDPDHPLYLEHYELREDIWHWLGRRAGK